MPNLAKTTVVLVFSKLIATDAEGTDAEVFGANTTAIIGDMIASVQTVVGPSVFIETQAVAETVVLIPSE